MVARSSTQDGLLQASARFPPEAHANVATVCTRHQSSRARLVQQALAFLKLDEATSLTGISFPPFPSFPISPSPGSRAGNVGNAGNVFGGDPSETCHLVSV